MHFFIFSLIACCFQALSGAHHWNYPDLEKDIHTSFPKWGGVCDNGKKQSPINLDSNKSLKKRIVPLMFKNYDLKPENLEIINNGHSIVLTGFDHKPTLSGGALSNDYVLEQFHFHWAAEHTIDHVRYPLEMHLVHRNTIYPNISVAAKSKEGIVVVGVMFHLSDTRPKAIQTIIKNLGPVKAHSSLNSPAPVPDSLAVSDLLPGADSYFTYSGSLTTPTCAEVVTWIVLTSTIPVYADQVNALKEIEYEEGKKRRHNYRNLQSENDREVFLVRSEENSAEARLPASVSWILPLALAGHKFLL